MTTKRRKILYLDMDNVLVDFDSGIDRTPADIRARYAGRMDEIPSIFALMDPMPGAVAAYARLAVAFDTYILSTAPWLNPGAWSDKVAFVQRELDSLTPDGPAYKRLILSHHKHLCVGDYLVDDRTKNGADRFTGEHVQFGTPQFPEWDTTLAYLLARA